MLREGPVERDTAVEQGIVAADNTNLGHGELAVRIVAVFAAL